MPRNPFKPSAGSAPPLLVGRQPMLDQVAESFADGPGAPARISIFTGARGVGKTVMLNEVEGLAHQRGWVVVSETASAGVLDRFAAHLDALIEHERPRARRRVTAVRLPGNVGVETELVAKPAAELEVALRTRVVELLDLMGRRGSGLLLTLDEIQAGRTEDLRAVGILTQHLVREDREFAIAMAGLPSGVSALLNDDVLTFLRRAERFVLRDVPVEEVEDALVETITDSGRSIDADASLAAAQATGGYPFLIQLVGYHVWRRADDGHVDGAAVQAGVADARARLGSLVHETALADLSGNDLAVLTAMASDDGPSSVAALAARTRMRRQNLNTYRRRLLEAGIVVPAGRGRIDFALPYLREYLRATTDR